MNRLGIFVDAGYLFAQGSTAIAGNPERRTNLSLNEEAVVTQLLETAADLSGGTPLLRIYWYDAIGDRGPTLEQKRLASSNNVKVRMGTLNGSGQQKGVDSMIVIDMIELARNHAIADAVLLSGDEDVRVGVQFAQSYGVRVHLIGIANEHDNSHQSLSLIQEADTHTEWTAKIVNSFLSIRHAAPRPNRALPPAVVEDPQAPAVNEGGMTDDEVIQLIEPVISGLVDALVPNDLQGLKELLHTSNSLPREFDGKLLGTCRDQIGMDLPPVAKRHARKRYIELVKAK
ncbi:NYN domain-containing protein [Pseudomonas aeruginosa]|uniref:NYN domain-containing protein n=1 Tax=Pseudomonas aeruginosa TaxID=287 RepID=B3G1A9_PSEAI|nr:NYN domain-containing protein [Pseudomonas aeruginosa]ACD38790.1 conserved hypothetical protein [Pseudomonas aeruginosa]ACD38865.1 hypothetical protein PACL_0607 [Pseudomonas aeruginosa]EZO07569.1 hypothetical protein AJ64_02336 [Pseudomonas aeruginosa 3577]MCS7565346.1 NYN domain-containing protein [Pseudomonas aeruginosa]RPV36973.1 NYN domain-containing protein [Pseudomonas aeruginosa]